MQRYRLLRRLRLAPPHYAINDRACHAHGPAREIDITPLQRKQFTLSQAGRRCQQHKRSLAKTKSVYQSLDFSGGEQARRLLPFGALPNKMNRVVIIEFVSASMVEQNRHHVSDFGTGALCQRKTPKPTLDFDRSNLK